MTKFFKSNSKAAKLSAAVVLLIRKRYAIGDVTQGQLAREYGVSCVQLGRIIRGESWAGVEQAAPTAQTMDEAIQRARMIQVEESIKKEGVESAAERMSKQAAKLREKSSDGMLNELVKKDS